MKEGWEGIDEIGDQNIDTLNKFDQLTSKVFETDIGKELLQLLTDQFLHAAVADPQNPASYAYWREGQNSLIRRFLTAINKKQQQTPPITETISTKKSKPEEIKK